MAFNATHLFHILSLFAYNQSWMYRTIPFPEPKPMTLRRYGLEWLWVASSKSSFQNILQLDSHILIVFAYRTVKKRVRDERGKDERERERKREGEREGWGPGKQVFLTDQSGTIENKINKYRGGTSDATTSSSIIVPLFMMSINFFPSKSAIFVFRK